MLLNSKWITYNTGEYKSADDKYGNPSPYFRKEFKVDKEIRKSLEDGTYTRQQVQSLVNIPTMLYDYKQSGCPKFIGVTTLFDTETTITWQITHFFVYLPYGTTYRY